MRSLLWQLLTYIESKTIYFSSVSNFTILCCCGRCRFFYADLAKNQQYRRSGSILQHFSFNSASVGTH